MGNWMRVKLEGSCDRAEVPALAKALEPGKDYEDYHCLVCGGLCGLPNWAAESIHAVGNLAERGFTPDDIRKRLEKLAVIAPSLSLTVHCGEDYEGDKCLSSVVLANGEVEITDPEIREIPHIPETQIATNMYAQLARYSKRL